MYNGRISIFNPYGPQIEERGLATTLSNTPEFFAPFLQLLGARWLVAAQNDPLLATNSIISMEGVKAPVIITHDWFVSDLVRYSEGTTLIRDYPGKIFVFSDLPPQSVDARYHAAAMNPFIIDRSHKWKPEKIYPYYDYFRETRTAIPIVPLGCSQDWLPKVYHTNRIIFLDEPHESYLECLGDKEDIRTVLYSHALDVTKILSERNFKIVSFCRSEGSKFIDILRDRSYIEATFTKGWVPFNELVRQYASASLFYSFTAETFGYPVYENLQIGNGVVTYNETHDPYTFLQLQNSAVLSTFMPPTVAADIICAFFDRIEKYSLRSKIASLAYESFSAETFIGRIRRTINVPMEGD